MMMKLCGRVVSMGLRQGQIEVFSRACPVQVAQQCGGPLMQTGWRVGTLAVREQGSPQPPTQLQQQRQAWQSVAAGSTQVSGVELCIFALAGHVNSEQQHTCCLQKAAA